MTDSRNIPEKQSKNKWLILANVAFGVLMATLDGSIVNIALPTIKTELQAGNAVQWIVIAYFLTTTGTLLIMGRIADIIGSKPVYVSGFIIFTIGSLLCGIAPGIWYLTAFRVVQGIGASMLFAVGPVIIANVFEPKDRGKALGLIGTIVATGNSLGPVLGGFLLGAMGWKSIFFVNIPLGIIAVIITIRNIPGRTATKKEYFDFPGALLFLAGAVLFLIGLYLGPLDAFGWNNSIVVLCIIAGIIFLACFLFWQKKAPVPMLNFALFKRKNYSYSIISAWLAFTATGANFFILPFYLQQILKYPPETAGFILLAGPATLSIVAPVGGFLSDRIGPRFIATVGLLITATGYFSFTFITENWDWHQIVWRNAVISLGFGLFQSPNSSRALNAAPVQLRGIGSSMLAFMRNLGLLMGVSIAAAIWYSFRKKIAYAAGIEELSTHAQVYGMHFVYYALTAFVLTAALLSYLNIPEHLEE
jgi:EmrB/QacA subfamily drug resistance transporter